MATKRMNDFAEASGSAFVYAESASGEQVKIPVSGMNVTFEDPDYTLLKAKVEELETRLNTRFTVANAKKLVKISLAQYNAMVEAGSVDLNSVYFITSAD